MANSPERRERALRVIPRRCRRLPADWPVRVETISGGKRLIAKVVNLSPTGLFVTTPIVFPVGTALQVAVALPRAAEPKSLVAAGRVRWVNHPSAPKVPELPGGMGIEFVDLDPCARTNLEAFLDERLVATPPPAERPARELPGEARQPHPA